MSLVTVGIVAPTPMVRAGLRALLGGGDIEIVGDAPSLADLSLAVSSADVLVVAGALLLEGNLYLPGDDLSAPPAVVALADDDRAVAVLQGMRLCGWGIVSPDAPSAEMQAAVVSASQGLVVLSLALAGNLVQRRSTVQTLEAGTLAEPLTARESEVLELLSQGLSNKLIARRLNISEHTIKFHVSSIYTKLNAASRTDAVSRGARLGLITL